MGHYIHDSNRDSISNYHIGRLQVQTFMLALRRGGGGNCRCKTTTGTGRVNGSGRRPQCGPVTTKVARTPLRHGRGRSGGRELEGAKPFETNEGQRS